MPKTSRYFHIGVLSIYFSLNYDKLERKHFSFQEYTELFFVNSSIFFPLIGTFSLCAFFAQSWGTLEALEAIYEFLFTAINGILLGQFLYMNP
jgi:hypothetical protein